MKKKFSSNFVRLTTWALVWMILLTPLSPAAASSRKVAVDNAASVSSFTVTTIYTNLPGHPSSDVPGMPGVHFGSGLFTPKFDRPFGSPNGNWILSADTDLPLTEDQIILVNGVVKARESITATWTISDNIGLIDQKLGINDNAEWVFATTTNGPITSTRYIVKVSAADVFTAAAREGDPIPALPGTTWSDIIDTAVIASDGTVGMHSDFISGTLATEDEIIVLGNTLLAQEGVTNPPNQLGSELWGNFDQDDFWISSDGGHWLVQGDLRGNTSLDDVVAVDGKVVVQEGAVLSGTSFTDPVDLNGIVGVHMAPNGDWYVRGNNAVSEQDWVYSNHGLVASLNAPIYSGATEVYSDTDFADGFFLHVGDSNGNYVIGGVTNNPSANNGVLVANSTAVIVRESDQIDLDNNGTPDDAYFDTFGDDDGYLSDAGIFYFTASIKDGTDTLIGYGFFSVDISSVYGDPSIDVTPTSLSSTQLPDTVITHTLTITNVGQSFLNWTIEEAALAPGVVGVSDAQIGPDHVVLNGEFANSCTPTDIPWVSVSPTNGSLIAGSSSTVDATFDSTGLSGGIVFTGTLCVSSNDPINPLITVPLTLTVEAVYGVDLSGDQAASALPGETITYTLAVTNTGNTTDTLDLSVSSVWATSQSDTSVLLGAGNSTAVWVAVTVPAGASGGDSDVATVTVTSQAEPTATDSASLTTTAGAVYGVDLSGNQAASGGAGATVSYVVSITNTGNAADTFDLSATGVWTATPSDATVTLGAGESVTFTVDVDIPGDAANGDFDVTMVTATSQSDASATDSADLTTTAVVEEPDGYIIYLPIIIKNK
ncbi:MAG TPA: NEW3 domain-containing protein [Anaerolineales bacterium]|nr:NEW3 domain-containing protein [Anaerolineales bacterium]